VHYTTNFFKILNTLKMIPNKYRGKGGEAATLWMDHRVGSCG